MFVHTITESETIALRIRDAWRYRLLMTKWERRRLYDLLRREAKRLRALRGEVQRATQ